MVMNPVDQRLLQEVTSPAERHPRQVEAILAEPHHLRVEVSQAAPPILRQAETTLEEQQMGPEQHHLILAHPLKLLLPNNRICSGRNHPRFLLFCTQPFFMKEFSETPCYTEYHDYRSVKP